MERVLILFLIVGISCSVLSVASQNCALTLSTSRLLASSNSTCGGNCSSPAQHYPAAVNDGDFSTWWESREGEETVLLNISLTSNTDGFTLSTLDIRFQDSLPRSIIVYSWQISQEPLRVYSTDCSSFPVGMCQDFVTILSANNTVVIQLVINAMVPELNFVFSGFQNNRTHFEVFEVTNVRGYITEGYFLPGLHYVLSEGEDGTLVNPGASINVGIDQTIFPNFSGQGYAILEYSTSQMLQLTLELKSNTSYDNIVIRYLNRRMHGTWIPATIMQGSKQCDVRFTIESNILCSKDCFARAVPLNDSCDNATLEMDHTVTVLAQLENSNFLLDYISAIPDALISTINECGLSVNDACVCSALQQSFDFYLSAQRCDCSNYSNSSVCDVYGGQCPCVADGGLVGRQCSICPFTRYRNDTDGGCVDCNCPDNSHCSNTGQCPCEMNVIGLKCDTCKPGTYGSPPSNCLACNCSNIGADGCNSTNGNCFCRPNVIGDTCSACQSGFYNLSSTGCQPCDCKEGSCNSSGICECNDGYAGSRCDQCDNGYFQTLNGTCLECNCSGRSSSCVLLPNSSSITPQEQCDCPVEYTGDSCQFCSSGYYLFNDTCISCNCNVNNSLTCNDTGECLLFPVPPPPLIYPPPLNCTPNTTGELCDSCAEGYYNSSIDPYQLICLPCPCHTNSSLNTSCEVINSLPVCFCLPGHQGSLCDSCSAGYYGMPPAYPCSTCMCSNNIDPNDENACNRTTGECISCLNNSTGPQCEECLDEFFGYAPTQTCQPCGCAVDGSSDLVCSKSSGVCNCLPGVEGNKCTQCQVNRWKYPDCMPCACSPNTSLSSQCNLVSGQCDCIDGVTGRTCDTCDTGYYNFTGLNCQRCNCSIGAVNDSCHQTTGQCYCNDNVVGLKCDQCSEFHDQLTSDGCIECDGCVQYLRRKPVTLEAELTVVDSSADNAASLQTADTLDLQTLKNSVNMLWVIYNATLLELSQIDSELAKRINQTRVDLTSLKEIVSDLLVNATVSLPRAEMTFRDAQDLYNSLEDIEGLNYTVSFVNLLRNRIAQVEASSNATLLSLNSSLQQLLQQPLSNNTDSIRNVLQNISYIEEHVTALFNRTTLESTNISALNVTASTLASRLYSLHLLISQLTAVTTSIRASIQSAQYRANTTLPIAANNVSLLINESISHINESDANIANITGTLSMTYSDISKLQNYLSDLVSGSGYNIGSAVSSGDIQIADRILLLKSSVSQLMNRLSQSSVNYENALSHADSVVMQGHTVCSVINASLSGGNAAIDAIMDYTFVNSTLTAAVQLVTATNITLTTVLQQLHSLMDDELNANITELHTNALALSSDLQALQADIMGLRMWYFQLVSEVNLTSVTFSSGLLQSLDILKTRYQLVQANTSATVSSILPVLSDTIGNIVAANMTYANMLVTHSDLIDDIKEITMELNGLSMDAMVIDEDLIEANTTAYEAQRDFQQRLSRLEMINAEHALLENEVNTAKSSMIDLQRQLREAQAAAAMVDIALRFHGNSTSTYNLPSSLQTDTHISLYFRPDSASGVLLTDGQNNSLQLENGQIRWSSGTQQIETDNFNLSFNRWYQVEASNEGSSLFLSVAPLQEPSNATTTVTVQTNPNTSPLTSSVVLAGTANNSYYSGCIDRVIVNGEMLPLLVPNTTTSTISACGPRLAAELSRPLESGAWFQGQSRLSLPFIDITNGSFTFSFLFRTFYSSSQLVFIQNSAMTQSIAVYINNSVTHLRVTLGNTDVQTPLSSNETVTDGNWHSITVTIMSLDVSFIVDEETTVRTLQFPAQNLTSPVNITFGRSSMLNLPSFPGCIANFSVDGTYIDLTLSEVVERVEVSNCPSLVSPGTRFMGTGSAVFAVSSFIESISFSFRTEQLSSVLVYLSSTGILPDRLKVTLFHTYLRVEMINTFNDIVITSQQSGLNDGQWHNVSVSLSGNYLLLNVDDVIHMKKVTNDTNFLLVMGDITVGGLPNGGPTSELITEYYRGCINDLSINGQYYDFNEAVLSDSVVLFGCHGDDSDEPPPTPTPSTVTSTMPMPMSSTESSDVFTVFSSFFSETSIFTPTTTIEPTFTLSTIPSPTPSDTPSPTPSPTPSTTPPAVPVGLSGHKDGFLSYSIQDIIITYYFEMILVFRTVSSNALLLYTQSNSNGDYMALELRNGALYYSYDLGAGAVFIASSPLSVRYDDNMNHTVIIRRNATEGALMVDGGAEYSGSSISGYTQLNTNQNPLFVGGVRPGLAIELYSDQENVPAGAFACFYSLIINGQSIDLSNPLAANHMEECQNNNNDYVSFNSSSSYARIVDMYRPLASYGFSLEFRTVTCSGLILYSSSLYRDDHTALELSAGKMRFIFNNGHDTGIVEYIPTDLSSLCDGNWHSVTVAKDRVTGSLTVDGQPSVSTTLLSTELVSVDTNSPLYVGGVPENVLVRYTIESTGSFQGCLNNLQLVDSNSGGTQSVTNVHFADVTDSSSVQLNTCHL